LVQVVIQLLCKELHLLQLTTAVNQSFQHLLQMVALHQIIQKHLAEQAVTEILAARPAELIYLVAAAVQEEQQAERLADQVLIPILLVQQLCMEAVVQDQVETQALHLQAAEAMAARQLQIEAAAAHNLHQVVVWQVLVQPAL
jgi:hypothetical protein